jgi:hypothetical protein
MKLSNRNREPVSLSSLELFRHGLGLTPFCAPREAFDQMIDPTLYHRYQDFLPDYWAVESFSKMPFDIGIDRKREALRSFIESEDFCKAETPRICRLDLTDGNIVRKVRTRLAWLLGDITPAEVMQRARWSPGATSSLKAAYANPQNKWGLATHTTSGTSFWMSAWNDKFQDGKFWSNLELVTSNRVLTVPKNAKTERVIAAEPDWNMFFQLGMGACFRRRLQRVGLLRSPRVGERVTPETEAQCRQQMYARIGSRYGNYATIDLKAASDTVSLAVCELLLPPKIFRMLCQLRSPQGVLPDGTTVTYEKISSMGNGNTFELETSLFWAISCVAADSEDVHVYGDDIIVPTETAARVVETLRLFGFKTNPKKTHITGLFRESCGGHYFAGTDVTPPYFRKELDRLTSIISGYNSLCQRVNGQGVSRVLYYGLMEGLAPFLRRQVPRALYGPPGLDGCLGLPYIEFVATRKKRRARRVISDKRRPDYQHVSGTRFVGVRPTHEAFPEWGLCHALYNAVEGSEYNAPDQRFVLRPWSAEVWSSLYPY